MAASYTGKFVQKDSDIVLWLSRYGFIKQIMKNYLFLVAYSQNLDNF